MSIHARFLERQGVNEVSGHTLKPWSTERTMKPWMEYWETEGEWKLQFLQSTYGKSAELWSCAYNFDHLPRKADFLKNNEQPEPEPAATETRKS